MRTHAGYFQGERIVWFVELEMCVTIRSYSSGQENDLETSTSIAERPISIFKSGSIRVGSRGEDHETNNIDKLRPPPI